ncbi:MAG: response regulator [Sphingomonadales bacterium]|nr:response regulator [Sphingomonadales bacterium]
MPLGAQVAESLPYLRRYARALTGSQASGDAFVRATLEAALADADLRESLKGGRVPLYRAFTVLWNSAGVDVDQGAAGREGAAQQRLAQMTPPSRQALLLTAVEEFSLADAAAIMDLPEVDVAELVLNASAEIARESTTSVLIIEDEPLIAMQLEQLVEGLGHRICGTAATRGQARQVVTERQPGLVLADIQLADGSSGLDAVDDILAITDVPVIFITAFPERLLTGNRPEPAYLITKPFREEAVKAAISQALFFRSAATVG